MKHQLLALALTASCLLQAQAVEPGKSQTLTAQDQVPEGLAKSDWQGIRQAYLAANGGPPIQQAYVKASNTGAGDGFGESVAVFADTVVVGVPNEDSNATSVGGDQTIRLLIQERPMCSPAVVTSGASKRI